MDLVQLDPDDFGKVIEFALEYGGVIVVALSFLVAFLRRGKRKEKKERQAALGKPHSYADPIEPGDDTTKLSERMSAHRSKPSQPKGRFDQRNSFGS